MSFLDSMNGSNHLQPSTKFSDRPKILLLLWHAILLTAAIAFMWLAIIGGYKATYLFKNFNQSEVPGHMPKFVVPFLKRLDVLYNSLYVFGILGCLLLILALLPWIGKKWRWRCAGGLAWLAGIAVIFAFLLGSASVTVNILGAQQPMFETLFYKRALQRFAILEATQGRFEKFQESMRRNDRIEYRTVSRLSEMPDQSRRERIKELLVTIKEHPTPVIQKATLATLSDIEFTDRVYPGTSRHFLSSDERQLLLETAALLAGRQFKTLEEAMNWVKEQPESDGWKRIPCFFMVEKQPQFLR